MPTATSAISTFLIASNVPFTRAIRSTSAVIVTVRFDWRPASISAICDEAPAGDGHADHQLDAAEISTGQAIGLNRLFVASG